ncbi:phosphoadenosine phosphosulfate reductase family protein [Streptomyces xiamenensis]|uniref:phosphoadenosine phosphosulfate reductase domain-containing protein n=1 Tax=Streptomyces xiamenensis TaxID=408015 RepID=UPI0035D9D63A
MITEHALATLELIRVADKAAVTLRTARKKWRDTANTADKAAADTARWRRLRTRAISVRLRDLCNLLIDDAEERHHRALAAEEKALAAHGRAWGKDLAASRAWRRAYSQASQTPDDPISEAARARATAALLGPLAAAPPEVMRSAHKIIIQSSGGKDSVVAMLRTMQWARDAGVTDKLIVVHSNLGDAEWPGVTDLVLRQAEMFGLDVRIVKPDGGFLGMVEARGMWPDSKRRLCTGTLKRDAITPLITEIVNDLGLPPGVQAIILNVFGIRAEESPARRLKEPLSIDPRASSTNRLVLTWNVIHELSERDVWKEIADNRLEYHQVYDSLLPRLSCVFCVLAGERWLIRAARVCFALGMDAPEVWTALEAKIEHSFKQKSSLASIIAEARRLDEEEGPLTWQRGDAIRHALGEASATDYLQSLDTAA